MASNPLLGTWRLLSAELTSPEGQVVFPYGIGPVGYLIYSEDGYMSANIMRAGRAKYASGSPVLATPEEKLAAYDGYSSYSGRYEIHGAKVLHHVEVCLYPDWVGTPQERLMDLKGNRLTLSMVLPILDVRHTLTLIWEHV